jgi:hypothetical protein
VRIYLFGSFNGSYDPCVGRRKDFGNEPMEKVPDIHTQELMKSFYEHLKEGYKEMLEEELTNEQKTVKQQVDKYYGIAN